MFGFHENHLLALLLEKRNNHYEINRIAAASLPQDLIKPSFSENNITNFEGLSYLVRETIENAELNRKRRWSVVLPNETARTTIVTIENKPNSKQELYEILDWKAERIFGVSAEELRISHEEIFSEDSGRIRYMITAIKLSILEEYETLFKMLEWNVGLILPRLIGEMKWLLDFQFGNSLLISFQGNSLSAVILQGNKPVTLRSMICKDEEIEDEVYRLFMFYKDHIAKDSDESLDRILLVGKEELKDSINKAAKEALEISPKILSAKDLYLQIPPVNISFDLIVSPAGVSKLAWG